MVIWIKENIHWFQVPVNHALLMDVSQTFNNLPEQSPYSFLVFKQPTVNSSPTTVKSTLLYNASQTATLFHNNGYCDWEITIHPDVYIHFSGRLFRYLVKISDQDGYHNWGFCGLLESVQEHAEIAPSTKVQKGYCPIPFTSEYHLIITRHHEQHGELCIRLGASSDGCNETRFIKQFIAGQYLAEECVTEQNDMPHSKQKREASTQH